MKRTFPLQAPGKDDARVRDKIRHEVNKALRRARQRPPQEGFRTWEFSCRIGRSETDAESLPVADIATAIDRIAAGGAPHVFIEIKPRPARPIPAADPSR